MTSDGVVAVISSSRRSSLSRNTSPSPDTRHCGRIDSECHVDSPKLFCRGRQGHPSGRHPGGPAPAHEREWLGRASAFTHQTRRPELDSAESVPLAWSVNDPVDRMVPGKSGRFEGLARLSTPEPQEAVHERERVATELDLKGAMLCGRTWERDLECVHNPFFSAVDGPIARNVAASVKTSANAIEKWKAGNYPATGRQPVLHLLLGTNASKLA